MKSVFLVLAMLWFTVSASAATDCKTDGRNPATANDCRTAGQLMDLNVAAPRFTAICRDIVNSDPACRKIQPEKRMNCSSKANNEILSSADLGSKVFQCLKGFIWDSMYELGKFVVDLVKAFVGFEVRTYTDMFHMLTDSEFRARKIREAQVNAGKAGRFASAFLNSSAQYFAREFPRNMTRHPFDPVAALGETLFRPLMTFLTDAVQSIISEYVPQYQCMNGPAKLHTLCKLAGDFLMPPAFVFSWMKFGTRGLMQLARTAGPKIAKLRNEFRAMNEVREAAAVERRAITVAEDAHPRPPHRAETPAPRRPEIPEPHRTQAPAAEPRAEAPREPQPPASIHPVHGADYQAPVGRTIWERSGGNVDEAQRLYGEEMARKFPDLAFLLRDPDQFARTMDERFAAQKLLTPNDPHLFDYHEVGIPLLHYMEKKIPEKIQELTRIRDALRAGTADARTRRFYPLAEVETNLSFLEDLMKETNEKLAAGKITYKDTVELSAWFSQAVANFDARQLPLNQRKLLDFDRALEAHVEHPIDVEYAKYKRREFHLFEPGKESITVGYREAGPGYEAAYNNKDSLGVIIIPSAVEIDCDVLYRLGNRQRLAITGVTKDPILADGFNRPAYDFWLHDVRHETVKYRYKQNYLTNNRIPAAGEEALNHRLDAWSLELQREVSRIEDPDMRRAAELITFNFHHDRGYPVAPSQYLNRPYKYIEYLLHSILTVSGQGSQVRNPLNIRRASRWLEDYWRRKLPEEEAFLNTLRPPQ